MSSGRTHSSNCSAVTKPSFERSLAQGEVLAVRLEGNLCRLLVADVRIERRHQHERVVEVFADALLVRLDAPGAAVVERARGLGQQLDRLQHVVQDHGLVDVELEVSLRAGEGHGVVVAEHLHGHHGQRLALGRIDLARHDRRARLVLRNLQLREACPRTAGVPAHVVGDLHQRAGEGAQRGADVHHARRAPTGRRTCSAPRRTACPSPPRSCRAATSPNRGSAFSPVPTAVPPIASA